jgi:hypothetical protein
MRPSGTDVTDVASEPYSFLIPRTTSNRWA